MQPNEPVVAAFFTELIANHLQNAPIQCGFAGEKKGKAIYAAKALKAGEPVWTEAPFVAMQHEDNKVGAFCVSLLLPFRSSSTRRLLLHESWRGSMFFFLIYGTA